MYIQWNPTLRTPLKCGHRDYTEKNLCPNCTLLYAVLQKPLNCGLPFFRIADTFTTVKPVLTYIFIHYIADRVQLHVVYFVAYLAYLIVAQPQNSTSTLAPWRSVRAKVPPSNGIAALFRASGGRVVDFTNYVFASIQKAFSNRETPIGKVPTHY